MDESKKIPKEKISLYCLGKDNAKGFQLRSELGVEGRLLHCDEKVDWNLPDVSRQIDKPADKAKEREACEFLDIIERKENLRWREKQSWGHITSELAKEANPATGSDEPFIDSQEGRYLTANPYASENKDHTEWNQRSEAWWQIVCCDIRKTWNELNDEKRLNSNGLPLPIEKMADGEIDSLELEVISYNRLAGLKWKTDKEKLQKQADVIRKFCHNMLAQVDELVKTYKQLEPSDDQAGRSDGLSYASGHFRKFSD